MEQEVNNIKEGDWVEFSDPAALLLTLGQTTAQVIELKNSRVYFFNKHQEKNWVPLGWCTKTNEKTSLMKKLFSTLDDEQSKP